MSRGKHAAVKKRKKQSGQNQRTGKVVAAAVLAGPVLMLGVASGANAARLGPSTGESMGSGEQTVGAPLVAGESALLPGGAEEPVVPADLVVAPPETVETPTEPPAVEPTEPVVTPTEPPVVDPTEPVITDPVVTPTDPVVTPGGPVVMPTEPVVPSAPAVKAPTPAAQPVAAVVPGSAGAHSSAGAVRDSGGVAAPMVATGAQLAQTGASENQILIGGLGAGLLAAGAGATALSRKKGRPSL